LGALNHTKNNVGTENPGHENAKHGGGDKFCTYVCKYNMYSVKHFEHIF